LFVKIENLNKIYQSGEKRQRVLDDLSLSLDKGKIYVLLGPSGSGKSTLLNIIGGLEEAEGGTVKVDGKDILSLNTTALAKYRRDYIGYVFQFYNLIQNLTVKENVDVCSYLGNPSMDINEVMERVGLKEHINLNSLSNYN
jgi:putative ABC transport system ATP-binding protein